MPLELADSGSITRDDSNAVRDETGLREAQWETSQPTAATEDGRMKAEIQQTQKVITADARIQTWYVLSEDPKDYWIVLDQIVALIDFAKDEIQFRKGMARMISYNPWIPATQIDADLWQCHPSFNQDADVNWRAAYKNGISAIIEKLKKSA